MKIEVRKFTKESIQDVVDFEKRLREEENDWGWEIDEEYVEAVTKSFEDSEFNGSISLLAFRGGATFTCPVIAMSKGQKD